MTSDIWIGVCTYFRIESLWADWSHTEVNAATGNAGHQSDGLPTVLSVNP